MTGSYSLLIKKSAERGLRAIAQTDLARIVKRILTLAQNPRPGCSSSSLEPLTAPTGHAASVATRSSS